MSTAILDASGNPIRKGINLDALEAAVVAAEQIERKRLVAERRVLEIREEYGAKAQRVKPYKANRQQRRAQAAAKRKQKHRG